MKHRLDGAMFYLAGPMDDVKDRGVGWREEIAEFLWSLNIGVLCPYHKATYDGIKEDIYYYNYILKLKRDGKYNEMHDVISDIVAEDYRMVDKADAIILYIDRNAHMCGSYHESGLAAYERKPVIICCEQGRHAIPHWLYGICNYEMFFNDWNGVKKYIKHVCFDDKVETHNRWRFFDYDKIFGRKK